MVKTGSLEKIILFPGNLFLDYDFNLICKTGEEKSKDQ